MYMFDSDISLENKEPFVLSAEISDNWSINGIPNGGYLMALLANAMLQHSDKKTMTILTANYLARCSRGGADIHVERISQSKQFSRFQAKLFQGGQEKVRMIGTFTGKVDECQIKKYESSAPDIPPPEGCLQVPEIPGYTFFRNMEVRLDPDCAGWMQNLMSEKSEHRGWTRFTDHRPLDMLSLPLVADAFPPPVISTQGLTAWVPTIEFSLNIRNAPVTEWLKGVFRTRFINCGLLEEDGELWDQNGELIAISRQIAQFRKSP